MNRRVKIITNNQIICEFKQSAFRCVDYRNITHVMLFVKDYDEDLDFIQINLDL